VIGNPPYIDSEEMTVSQKSTREYCTPRYEAASGNWDIFCVFSERAIEVCRAGGRLAFIVPNKLGSAEYSAGVRRVLTRNNTLISIRDYSNIPVFPVSVYPIVFVCQRGNRSRDDVLFQRMSLSDDSSIGVQEAHQLVYDKYFSTPEMPWQIFSSIGNGEIISKLNIHPTLEDVCDVTGAATVAEAYELKGILADSSSYADGDLKFLNSGTIDRYTILWGNKRCRYLGDGYDRPIVPSDKVPELPSRRFSQARAKKIVVAGMTKYLECIADFDGAYLAGKSTSVIIPHELDLAYLLAILNSSLISFFYSTVYGGNKLAGGYLRIGPPQLKKIPICVDQLDVGNHISELSKQLCDKCEKALTANTAHQKTLLQRQIESTDREIDRLVYELYGLTEEEIAIVEEATKT
jgi:hypothetical protein